MGKNLLLTFLFVFIYGFSFSQNECNTAILLTDLDNYCSPAGTYTNATATTSAFGAPTCWTGALQQDVWFKFVAVAPNVNIKIYGQEYNSGTLRRPRIALYSGNCATTITELACKMSATGEHFVDLYKGGLTVGQTYLIRVDALNGGAFNGTFALCINNYLAPFVAAQDCPTATYICTMDPISFEFKGGGGSSNDEANNSCLDDYNNPFPSASESNSVWLVFQCGTPGTLEFLLAPTEQGEDLDFALYRLPSGPGNCAGKVLLRCMAASCMQGANSYTGLNSIATDNIENAGCAAPNNNFLAPLNMVAGETYALVINNFTSGGNGFQLVFGGTGGFKDFKADFEVQRDCGSNEVTFIDQSENAAIYDWNFGINASTVTSSLPGPHTITYPPGSHTAVLTITEASGCQDLQYYTFDVPVPAPSISTNITNVTCGGSNNGAITINVLSGVGPFQYSINGGLTSVSSALTSYTFSGLASGSYDVLVIADNQCTESVNVNVGGGSGTISPTFTPRPPICVGGALSALPTTSTNGITGSWSPALNNSTTTLYTFTPTAGQCATTATMSITVNSNVTPTFNAVAPICAGGSLSPLPTTSTNGISGSWTPALNNLTTTLYTFTPTAGQCATTATMSITVNSNVTPTFNAVAPICAGGSLSPLPTTSTNGITGSWSPALNNSTTTLYTFTPTAGQCATTTTLTITINALPTVTSASPSYSVCSGPTLATASSPTINLTPNPAGASIAWTGSDGSSGVGSPIINPIPNNTCTDLIFTYTITPTFGCVGNPITVTTTVRPKPIATFTVTPNPNCILQTATVTFTGTSCPGASYNWTWPAGVSVVSGSGSGPYTISFASATTYNISLQIIGPASLGSCTSPTVTVPVTINSSITPTFTPIAPICAGGSLSPLPTTSTNGITGSWTPALNNSTTTLYTFTPTAGQCATTATMSITVNSNVTPTFNAVAPICAGGSLSPLPTTSTNGITGSWSPALNNSTTTLYTFTPTAGQCATTTTMSITVNSNVTPTFNAVAPICAGGSLSPLPTTSINGITGSWSPALNNSTTTLYTFTPTAGQCATTATMSITVNSNVTPTFNAVAPICAGGSLSPLPTTSTNGITGSWSPALNNSTTTLYTFNPNAGECATTITMSILVNQLNAVTVNATTCNPANVGTTVQNLLNQFGCDSIVTTTTTLLPSNTITINATTCNPANVGTTVQNLLNQFGCDSMVTTVTTLNSIYDIQLTATTCDPLNVGVSVQNLLSVEGCDSIVTTTTTLLPSNTITINATTCNPANVGTTIQNLLNQFGCDSVVTTVTTLNSIYDIQLTATTCDPLNVGVSVQNLLSVEGCDSIVTTTTTLLPSNAITINATTCNPANVGTTIQNLLNQFGCDSMVTTSYDQLTATCTKMPE
jgi:hypothetical protein